MSHRRTAFAVVIALLLLASLLLLLWPRDTAIRPRGAPVAAPTRAPERPASPRPTPRPPEALEVVAKAGGPEAWFPDQSLHRCSAPDGLPDGRYIADTARVLVREGQVLVAGEDQGEAPPCATWAPSSPTSPGRAASA